MNVELLAEMLDHIVQEGHNLHSVLVMRHDVPVMDAYLYPHGPEALHDLRSVAKSIISLLIGIAIDKGYLAGLEVPVLDFFPRRTFAHLDERKRAITLSHLLTMTSGLALTDPDTGLMRQSPDWVQFVLDRPMAAAPGGRFQYATGNVHLLSAILQQATGQSTRAFAREYLFGPLGITDLRWGSDPQGVTAGMDLFLTPRDMAKIGTLMLHGGWWEGRRIVSAAWVKTSTRPHVTLEGRAGYGYLWWAHDRGYYAAHGFGGQHIFVLPKRDVVAVFTGGLKGPEPSLPQELLERYIIPAARADGLPARVESLHGVFNVPDPEPVPSLPDAARTIGGRTYALTANAFGWERITFTFTPGANVAYVSVNNQPGVPLGLDGVYRITPGGKFIHWLPFTLPVALKGRWEDADTLAVHYQELGVPEPHVVRFTFRQEAVQVQAVETLNDDVEQFDGAWEG